MSNNGRDIEYYKARPDLYRVLNNGTVLDLAKAAKGKGGIIAAFPEHNPHAITKENSRHLHALRKAQGLRSRLLGMVDAAREHGLSIPDPDSLSDEELIQAGGDAVRLMVQHTLNTYLKSGNLRGMAEVFSKILEPFNADESEKARPVHIENLNVGMASLIADILKQRQQEATDATILDATLELVEAIENDRRNNLPNLAEPG